MVTPIKGEDKFQEWVAARIHGAGGHYQDHRHSSQPNVPDLSCSIGGYDYWLELKFGHFKLLHAKYDDFSFDTLTRGQLEWLRQRQKTGRAICGVLGYFTVSGDYPTPGYVSAYVFFCTPDRYLNWLWQKYVSAGAVLFTKYAIAAENVSTGAALFNFIYEGALGARHNARALRG